MDFLPDIEKQERLLDELAAIVARRGPDAFASGPLVLPNEAFFPDAWTQDGEGVWRLSERVMALAGLSHLASVIRVVRADEMPDETALATFDGLVDDQCYFCVRLDLVDDPTGLAAALAHEAAHAYREFHGLVTDGPDEELLTDLTMVFLGFGVFALNAAYRYTATGRLDSGWVITEYAHKTQGYLAMQDFAYLLAVQCAVRNFDAEARRDVERYLGANQTACFRKAFKSVREKRDMLRSRLGISRTTGPIPAKVSTPVRALQPSVHLLYDAGKEAPTPAVVRRTANAGLPVFRIARHHGWFWAGIGAAVAFGAIAALWDRLESFLDPPMGLLAIATAAAFAYSVARGRPYDQCSESECEKRLPPDATVCPGCGGRIVGRLKRASDRLEAREALEEKRLDKLLKRK